jgi:hypothetical protein
MGPVRNRTLAHTGRGPAPLHRAAPCLVQSICCCRELPQLHLQPIEIDRPREKISRPKVVGAAAPLIIAIGGDLYDRQIGEAALDLAEEPQSVHSRHADIRRDQRLVDLDQIFPKGGTSGGYGADETDAAAKNGIV